MHSRSSTYIRLAALCLLGVCARPVRSEAPGNTSVGAPTAPQKARATVERGLAFLKKDAAKWRTEHGCATCHHGTMTVWALSEAQSRGYAVSAETLADTVRWTKDQFIPRFSKPRDTRPGWNLVSQPALYLGMMSQNLPILSRDEVNQIARHIADHQEEDGAWILGPPANAAPPVWESREVVALLASLAREPYVPADPKKAAEARASREKAVAWLSQAKPTDTTQAAALRLLLNVRTTTDEKQIKARIDDLLNRQNADGSWSQIKELAGDAYATGQALYVLSFAGVKNDRPEIRRAVSFLVATQRDDGSWPMTSRNHPGVKATRNPIRNPVPITYFGSAWASLGLVRTVPTVPDTAANRQLALDQIRAFHGKYEVDEQSADRPVVSVDLRYYEVSDDEVAEFAKNLEAFPRLTELHFKSSKITDAGLAHLKGLPRLQIVSLENAMITDAGLVHLNTMTQLRELRLKDTKVTDAGIQGLRKAQPLVKVGR